jgi:hypothetical protein
MKALTLTALINLRVEVLEEYKHPDLTTPGGYPVELDFYYPQIKIAVEYHVEQHAKSYLII